MPFLIADTFTASLARLTAAEQKTAKMTAFDLQMNPASPGMQLHKLERAKDRNFWSVRVSSDLRLIVHKTDASLLLCYVGHHDAAYRWAEQRKLERHPVTGAAQLVEIRETVREIAIPRYVQTETIDKSAARDRAELQRSRALFAAVADADLLSYGVPAEWLDDVRRVTEDSLFDLAGHLPGEAAEALLELATGGTPKQPPVVTPLAPPDPFAHPDAQRRFRVMTNADELRQALEFPWEKWTVFLHPAQREVVGRRYSGPARVSGSAGTGKTIVALHRAVHLVRAHRDARVLLTTFSDTLAQALEVKLDRLVGTERGVRDRIAVQAIDRVGLEIYRAGVKGSAATIADPGTIRPMLARASPAAPAHRFTDRFLEAEWFDVIDAWQLTTWEAYRDVARLGRKTRLGEPQRTILWSIFERVRSELAGQGFVTMPGVFAKATAHLVAGADRPFDFVVVDESQDVSVPQLRFLAALAGDRPEGLFFAGDLGQRIFQTPFSWRSLGVDIRGRSHTLRINYRTSHQIRRQADRLLGAAVTDVDGNTESRTGTISAFDGPEPVVRILESREAETATIVDWLRARIADGVPPAEMAVVVRSEAELDRARVAVRAAGLKVEHLGGLLTMHLAKGLEFRALVVAACDDEVVPLQSRIESVTDEADLEDVYETERHLLYVACTRARDSLLVTGVTPGSEFLRDLENAHVHRRNT